MYFYCHAQVAALQAAHMLHSRMKLNEYCSPWEDKLVSSYLDYLLQTYVLLYMYIFCGVYFPKKFKNILKKAKEHILIESSLGRGGWG